MAEAYRVSSKAYVKLLLHAAKHPHASCTGLLVGEECGHAYRVTDVVPLFHHKSPLAPQLEAACATVDAWCQQHKLKIVGVYQANECDVTEGSAGPVLDVIGQKIADKVDANCSRACVLLVNPPSPPMLCCC